jgi:hypothetical protein
MEKFQKILAQLASSAHGNETYFALKGVIEKEKTEALAAQYEKFFIFRPYALERN